MSIALALKLYDVRTSVRLVSTTAPVSLNDNARLLAPSNFSDECEAYEAVAWRFKLAYVKGDLAAASVLRKLKISRDRAFAASRARALIVSTTSIIPFAARLRMANNARRQAF